MKQNISPGVVVAVVIAVVVGVLFFGWHAVSGGANGDVTEQNIKHWQDAKAQANAHKMTMETAPKMGAPMSAPATK